MVLKYAKFFVVIAFLVWLDFISKRWFANNMQLGESIPVIEGFFHFTLVHNQGAAFGIGADWSRWIFHLSSCVALGVLLYLFFKIEHEDKWSRVAFLLILAGAFGNVADRVRLGYVIDFLDVFVGTYHWPAFNLADSYISIGACILGIHMLRGSYGNPQK